MSPQNEDKPDTTSLHAEVAALRAENAKLLQQLRIYERLVPEPIVEVDRSLRVTRHTRAYDGFGEETIMRNPFASVEPAQRDGVKAALRQVFADGRSATLSVSVRREDDGRPVQFRILVTPADESSEPQTLYALVQDVTEQRALAAEAETQRAYFQAIFEQAADMIFLAGDDMRCVAANPALAATLGYSAEEMCALSLPDIFPHMALADGPERWQAFLVNGALRGTAQMRRKDGTLFDAEFRAVANIIPGVHMSITRDVSVQKQAEHDVAQSRASYQAIFENATDMILLTDDDMRYIDANPAAAAALGYTVEELRGLAVTDVFPPMEQATARSLWQAFIAEGSQAGEVQVRRKDGTLVDADYRAVANILPGVHLSIIRDIGERKRLEAALARSEAYYRAIFDHAPIGMGISDPSGRPVAWNAAMAQASGVSDADVRALDHVADLYATPEERQRLLDLLVAQGSVQRAAVRMRRADGSSYPVRMSLQPIELSGGRHLLAMMEDVTEEVDARAQEAFLASVMSNLQDAVTVTDSAGRVIFWNAGAEALSGVSAGQILGRRYRDFFGFRESSPNPVPEIRRALEATGHWEGEIPLVLLNGSELWTWTAISQLHGKDGAITGRIAVIYDLTEQRALEAANRRQAQILNGVMEAIIVTDLAFNITDWNANADAMYGWRAGEVVGRSVDALLGTEHEDLDAVLAEFRDKGRWQGEVSQRHKDGQSLCVLASVSYVYDDGGAPVAVVAVNRDITRRHDAENALRTAQSDLRRLMRRLERTEMTQRKELARNLHDDLGATLTAVRLDIDWLDAHLHDSAPPDVIAKLERMAGLATAAIRTTQAVTSDLRPSLLDDLGLVAALEYLAETWSTAAAIPADLHLDEALEERLDPELAMDLYRIAQEALTNVARHAAATQATLELTEEDGQVVLLVADNGRGVEIDRQIAAEALGLIGMRERAEAWDGSMVLTGAPGRGSILTVRIPLDAATMAGGGSDPGPDDAPGKP
ncbi:MAG: PAS domain S-box protein [Caldilineaceae bacterium]|nr:PAS domain S-box protein [Caldilineaceae bacterium]